MNCAVQKNIRICQGKTYFKEFLWGVGPLIYKPIESIDRSAPLVMKVPNHDLIDDWPFYITHVQGMRDINDNPDTPINPRFARVIDADTLELNSVVSLDFGQHTPNTGVIRYATYPNFSGMEARMQIRNRVGGTVLLSLTSQPDGGIVLDNLNKKIVIEVGADVTEGFGWKRGVYDLEIEDISGRVYGIAYGSVSLFKEVTKPI
jgi:hypothetical protein